MTDGDPLVFASPAQAFFAQAKAMPQAMFLCAPAAAELSYAPGGFVYSYEAVAGRIEAFRAAFAAAGYGRGARVALMLDNRTEFFWVWLALNSLGVCILPINPELRANDIA